MVELSTILLMHPQNKDSIEAVLMSVLEQNYSDFEVILVDGGKSLGKKCKKYTNKYELPAKIVNAPLESPISVARNLGVSKSEGDTVIFLDGDTILCDENAFSKIVEHAKHFSHGYGSKRFWTYPPLYFEKNIDAYKSCIKKGEFDWAVDSSRAIWPSNGIDRGSGYRDLQGYSFIGNFGFAQRDLFDSVGGYSTLFKTYGCEDDYLAYCLYKKNPAGFKRLFEIPVLHVNHPVIHKDTGKEGHSSNFELLRSLYLKDGFSFFNINVLFGVPDRADEPVLEKQNG